MIAIPIILLTIIQIKGFEFSPPSVTAIPLTINTQAVYDISIDRAYTSDLVETRWSEQLVPGGSNITIAFPVEYGFTAANEPRLEAVVIDGVEAATAVMVRSDSRTLVIKGGIPSSLAVNMILITISNVLNPTPALTTSPFTVRVGNDFSSPAGDSNSIITLVPDQFTSCGLTFNPSITNTTGDMLISITPKTAIPLSGSLVIDFPVTLQWIQDISLSHPLQIDKVSNCSVVSTEISSVTCVGLRTRQQITIKFNSPNATQITQPFTITVKGLFSPPTVNSTDTLKFSSYTIEAYALDTCTSRVTNLQPQTLNLIIEASLSPLLIDSWTTLSFNFTNTDTITRDDYFEVVFPSPTTISFSRSMSSLALASGAYTSSTLTLRFNPLSSAVNINANNNNYIRFLNYRTPPTTKETDFIVFTIYSSSGRKKMEGRSRLKAVQRTYNITPQSGDSLGINDVTSYYLTINVINAVSSSAMVKITLPSQLLVTNASSCPKSLNTSASNATTCTVSTSSNTTNITVKSLWQVVPSGQQRIELPFIKNPGYSTNLSSFKVSLYFNQSEEHLVADYVSEGSNNLTILPKRIDVLTAKVELNDYRVAANNVTYFVTFVVGNDIPLNGLVDVFMPLTRSFLFAPGTDFKCLITYGSVTDSLRTCSFNISQKSVRVFTGQPISSLNQIKLTLQDCCSNPFNTRPTSLPGIQTLTAGLNIIEYLDTSLPVSGFVEIRLKSQSVMRVSDTNSQSNIWSVNFEQVQAIDEVASRIEMSFEWSGLNSVTSVKVSNMAVSEQATFTVAVNNRSLQITFPASMVNSHKFTFTLTTITNPPTFQPLTCLISTRTSDNHTYASSNFTLAPTSLPSQFASFSYVFGTRVIGSLSTIGLTVSNREDSVNQIGRFVLFNLSQYMEGNNTVACDGSAVYTCSLSPDNNILTITVTNTTALIPNPLAITLLNLYIRPSANFLPMTFSSFSIADFKASEFTNIEFGPLCTLPCRQCVSATQLRKCTSCFESPSISLQKYLFNFSCYEHCPNRTFKSFDTTLTTYQYLCSNCSSECLTCDFLPTNCTSCNITSVNKYFYLFQCLQICPNLTYPSTASSGQPICTPCISPCLSCTTQTICTSCVPTHFFYLGKCLTSCPVNTTVENIAAGTCDNCSIQCKSCEDLANKCLQCATVGNLTYLYFEDLFQCVAACPADRVMDKTRKKCVFCEAPCMQCSGVEDNCTSCLNGTFLSFTQLNACVTSCEPLSFENATSNKCLSCASALNCKNCSSATTCYECDIFTVYVFFGLNSSCLEAVPPGYVNVSGVAVKCDPSCDECTLTPSTCSVCNTGQFLLNGQCKSSCDDGFVGMNSLCVPCQGGCQYCSISTTNCTQCYNVYYFINNTSVPPALSTQNQCVIRCPSGYFHSSFNISLGGKACNSCEGPCQTCQNLTYCLSCVSGYIYNGQCLATCPNRTLMNDQEMACKDCASPCLDCINATYECMSCVSGYYFYQPYSRCYLPAQCPHNLSIPNNSTQACQTCQSPCFTCINSTTKCLSCIESTFLYDQAYQCVITCPNGFYASFGQCLKCKPQCTQCQSSSNCSQCASSFSLYEYHCLASCPVAYSIIINSTCTKCKAWCLNCSQIDYCYQCDSSAILLNGDCLLSCPTSFTLVYNTSTNQRSCKTAQQLANLYLQEKLSGPPLSSILPLPFMIISSVIFAASFMSKIQYEGTYVFGWAYVVYGVAEVASLAYFFYKFWIFNQTHSQIIAADAELQYDFLLKLLIGCLGLIGILNFFSTTCGSFNLTEDPFFAEWMRIKKRRSSKNHKNLLNQQSNNQVLNVSNGSISEQAQTAGQSPAPYHSEKICCEPMNSFLLTTIFSLVSSFKFRFILFSRLFDLIFFSARLEDVQKFRFFNILTLIGFCYEGCGIFIMYKVLTVYESKFKGEFLLTAIDCLSLFIVNIIVGVISMNKGNDFLDEVEAKEVDEKQTNDEKSLHNKVTSDRVLSSKRKLNQQKNLANYKNKIANTYEDLALTSPKKSSKKGKVKASPPSKTPSSIIDQKQPQLISDKNKNAIFQVKNGKLVPQSEVIDQDEEQSQQNLNAYIKDQIQRKRKSLKKYQKHEQSPQKVERELKVKKVVSKIINPKDQKMADQKQPKRYLKSPPKNAYTNQSPIESPQFLNQASKERRKKPTQLLQHNIRSPHHPIQQQLLKSKLAETVPEWQPKIKQARLKRQSLSHMDLIDLYNPNLEMIKQFQRSATEYALSLVAGKKVIGAEVPMQNQHEEDFVQNKVGWLKKITEEPESLEAQPDQLKSKLPELNNNFENRTFEEGKLFSSNPNQSPSNADIQKDNQTKKNLLMHEQSFEKILPFIHVEETKELVQAKFQKPKKKKQPRTKFAQESKKSEMKVRNIFDQSEDQNNQNSIDQQASNEQNEELPVSSKKFRSFGH